MKLRKISFKIVSLVMVLAILFGASATTISAATEGVQHDHTEENDKHYVSLGDSMTNGYGLSGYDGESGVEDYGYGSYANIFAEEIGAEHTQLAMSAMRPEDLHWILEFDYNNPELVALVDSIVTYGKAAAGALEEDLTADFTGVGTVTEEGDIFVGLGATLAQSASAKLTVDTSKLDEAYTLTATFGGKTVINNKPVMDYVENGAIYVTGIYAANYSDKITVTVYDGAEAIASISFTLNEYLNTLNASATGKATRNLIAATYNYGVATVNFAS
jgi:hypothetical protein